MYYFTGPAERTTKDDNPKQATKVLMILAVGVNASWKLPLAYCLTDSTNADLQTTLITDIISKLYRCGCYAISITMDGLPANLKTLQKLGCKVKPNNLDSTFAHPIFNDGAVGAILDACHMMKLARNTLAEYREIYVPFVGTAKWQHLEMLQKEQTMQQLTLGNKISKSHIQYQNQKMKVRLAVQIFSASAAMALRYMRLSGHSNFQDSQPTEDFLLKMNELFDYLNSRSPFGKGTKHPINSRNIEQRENFLREMKDYLLNLEDKNGNLLANTKRRTFIIGLILTIDSTIYLSRQLILGPGINGIKLKYLLTYKMSQDNLETVFATVRKRGGCNNNPSALQFRSIYKSILNHVGVVGTGQENILIVEEDLDINSNPFDTPDVTTDDLPFAQLSLYVENVTTYIAGFVVRKLLPRIHCDECRELLVDKEKHPKPNTYFLQLKNNGGLITPSAYTTTIIQIAEHEWRRMIAPATTLQTKHTQQFVINVLKRVNFDQLPGTHTHLANTLNVIDSHIHSLTRLVIGQYLTLRAHHSLKSVNDEHQQTKVRQKLTKLILFKNQ